MKTVIYFIFIIGWAVLQARRKAVREAKRKEQEGQRAQEFVRQNQPQTIVRGPVTADENQSAPIDEPDLPQYALQPSYLDQAPQEVRQFVESARPKKKKKRSVDDSPEQKVEEIVPTVSLEPDAYAQKFTVRRDIGFDAAALRTFIVTREVLGPPRSKRPHRPGISGK